MGEGTDRSEGTEAGMPRRRTVRELREARGMSREELAVALRTTFSTLVRIELGKTRPRLDLAERIYQFFDVPVGAIEWGKRPGVGSDEGSSGSSGGPA
jgi:transcriptional regulator with XRE-family HTH domain